MRRRILRAEGGIHLVTSVATGRRGTRSYQFNGAARSLFPKNGPFPESWLFLHCGIAIPWRGTTVPRHGTAVLRRGTAVPRSGTTILRCGTTVPWRGTAILRSCKAVPRHGTVILWRGMTIRRRWWMAHPWTATGFRPCLPLLGIQNQGVSTRLVQ